MLGDVLPQEQGYTISNPALAYRLGNHGDANVSPNRQCFQPQHYPISLGASQYVSRPWHCPSAVLGHDCALEWLYDL